MSTFYDDASLIMYPSGYKANKIYSLKPTDGSGDLDFTRASTARRVNADGLIETVASGVPRIDYTGGGCGKLLLEPQRTNLALYSEQFDNAVWNKEPDTTTITENNAVSPDGTQNADLFGSSSPSAEAGVYQTILGLTPSATYYISAYVKLGTATNVCIAVNNTIAWDTVGGQSFSAADGLNTNTWTRVGFSFTAPAGANINYHIGQHQQSGVNPQSLGTFLVWGAQLEEGSYPTSYIPTAGATATRVADTCSKTGISSLIGQTEGVIYWEGIINGFDINFSNIVTGEKNTTTSFAILHKGNSSQFQCSVFDGSEKGKCIGGSVSVGESCKIAYAYKSGDFALYVNGVSVATSTDTWTPPSTIDDIFIGDTTSYFGNKESNSHKQINLYTTRLTNTQLAELTTL